MSTFAACVPLRAQIPLRLRLKAARDRCFNRMKCAMSAAPAGAAGAPQQPEFRYASKATERVQQTAILDPISTGTISDFGGW